MFVVGFLVNGKMLLWLGQFWGPLFSFIPFHSWFETLISHPLILDFRLGGLVMSKTLLPSSIITKSPQNGKLYALCVLTWKVSGQETKPRMIWLLRYMQSLNNEQSCFFKEFNGKSKNLVMREISIIGLWYYILLFYKIRKWNRWGTWW